MMKKNLALLLSLILVLSLGMTAFAETTEETTPSDMETVTITKNYELTNPGSVSPAETFAFTIERTAVSDAAEGVTVENMPLPEIGSVSYAQGDAGGAETKSKNITVTLPQYTSVGIYTYTVKETAGTTAGVTYYSKPITLKVTVIEADGKIRVAAVHAEADGEAKSDSFPNTYSAGNLSFSKTVTGNLGDRSKYFKVTVTLTGEAGKTYAASYEVTGGSDARNPATVSVGTPAVFWLRHGETITVKNLPYGVSYTVTEDNYTADGYNTSYSYSDDDKVITAGAESVGITNNKGATVDTGIGTNNIPYIAALVLAALGLVLLPLRKRRGQENE